MQQKKIREPVIGAVVPEWFRRKTQTGRKNDGLSVQICSGARWNPHSVRSFFRAAAVMTAALAALLLVSSQHVSAKTSGKQQVSGKGQIAVTYEVKKPAEKANVPVGNGTAGATETVKTGDAFTAAGYLMISVLAGGTACRLIIRKRKSV